MRHFSPSKLAQCYNDLALPSLSSPASPAFPYQTSFYTSAIAKLPYHLALSHRFSSLCVASLFRLLSVPRIPSLSLRVKNQFIQLICFSWEVPLYIFLLPKRCAHPCPHQNFWGRIRTQTITKPFPTALQTPLSCTRFCYCLASDCWVLEIGLFKARMYLS